MPTSYLRIWRNKKVCTCFNSMSLCKRIFTNTTTTTTTTTTDTKKSSLVIVVDLYRGKYHAFKEYGFARVDIESFRNSQEDWCRSRNLDYCNALVHSGPCTCSICTGTFAILNRSLYGVKTMDWNHVHGDGKKNIIPGRCMESIRSAIEDRLRITRCGVLSVLVEIDGDDLSFHYRRKKASHALVSDARCVKESHSEYFALEYLQKLSVMASSKRYVMIVTTIPCPSCSSMLM